MTARSLLLLDTASLYFRAYYSVPEGMTAPDGTPVNAVRGLLDTIARLVETYRPERLVCCWDDDWRPQWRVDLVPSYKGHRVLGGVDPDTGAPLDGSLDEGSGDGTEEVPDTLSPQVPVIVDVLAALGIARVGAPGYEADDVIGTLAATAAGPTLVVTGDRDLFQVVDDDRGVAVLYTVAGGMPKWQELDGPAVRERYGVDPAVYADFAVLRGDASDGLPGVRGVGEKTAARLVDAFGDLAGVRAVAADPTSVRPMTPAVRAALLAAADYLERAEPVVRVATDVALPEHDARLPSAPPDPDLLGALAERWGLGGSVSRVLAALAAGA
ncbi:MAG: 5'-3' exonuclease H3TH domain-containing protein [Candidatus Nanopelagicales bacterium]